MAARIPPLHELSSPVPGLRDRELQIVGGQGNDIVTVTPSGTGRMFVNVTLQGSGNVRQFYNLTDVDRTRGSRRMAEPPVGGVGSVVRSQCDLWRPRRRPSQGGDGYNPIVVDRVTTPYWVASSGTCLAVGDGLGSGVWLSRGRRAVWWVGRRHSRES